MSIRRRLALLAAGTLGVGLVYGSVTPPPAVSATASVNFSAVGDFGATSNTDKVLAGIASRADDLTLAVGDLSYGAPGTEDAWCKRVVDGVGAGYPFELISGNHESAGENGEINNFSACLPNQLPGVIGTYGRQYYVDVPKNAPLVRFVMISPNLKFPDGTWWDYSAGSARYNWTKSVIDQARASGIPWVVVGQHKPCLSLGSYGCEAGAADLTNMLIDKRVDLVLQGHEHLYQRTKQLARSAACPTVPVNAYDSRCVANASSNMVKGAGTVFTTVGLGGYELRNVTTTDPEAGYFAAWSGANRSPSYGSLAVNVTADHLTARFVPVGGGTFTDTMSITKDGVAPGPVDPAPVRTQLATDTFSRTLTSGWGTAELGGSWTTAPSTATSVSNSAGKVALVKGGTSSALLNSISASNVDARLTLTPQSLPTLGSGLYHHVIVRKAGTAQYRARVRFQPGGTVTLALVRSDGGTETSISKEVTVATGYVANKPLNVHVETVGTAPTTVRASAWVQGAAEPTQWMVAVSDSTPALQTPGAIGLFSYLSGSSNNGTFVTLVDNLSATKQ